MRVMNKQTNQDLYHFRRMHVALKVYGTFGILLMGFCITYISTFVQILIFPSHSYKSNPLVFHGMVDPKHQVEVAHVYQKLRLCVL